jgi:hypothetical protein
MYLVQGEMNRLYKHKVKKDYTEVIKECCVPHNHGNDKDNAKLLKCKNKAIPSD